MKSRRKPPAGFKVIDIPIDIYDIVDVPLADISELLLDKVQVGTVDPQIEEIHSGGWNDPDLAITGFRPMTDKELAYAKKRSESAKRTAKERKEKQDAAERREFERLAKKYG